jgi:hypothetical protein
MQDEVSHFQLDRGNFNDLMDIVRLDIVQAATATGIFARIEFFDFGWLEGLLPDALAFFLSFRCGSFSSLLLVKGLSLEGGLLEFVESALSRASKSSIRSLRA